MITLVRIHDADLPERPIYRVENDGVLLFEALRSQDAECWNFRTGEGDDWAVQVDSLAALLQGVYELYLHSLGLGAYVIPHRFGVNHTFQAPATKELERIPGERIGSHGAGRIYIDVTDHPIVGGLRL